MVMSMLYEQKETGKIRSHEQIPASSSDGILDIKFEEQVVNIEMVEIKFNCMGSCLSIASDTKMQLMRREENRHFICVTVTCPTI